MSFLTSAFCVEVGYTKHYFLGKHLEVHFERIVALCLRKQANQILINFMHLPLNTRKMYTMNNELDPATVFWFDIDLQVLKYHAIKTQSHA